ncbi:MAG: ABC transporter substrate-binding protein [Anaerolineae bacterium]
MKHWRLLLTLCLVGLLATVSFAQDDEEMMDEAMMGDYETCPTPENLPETVTIGAIFGLSGDISVYGGVQQQGVDLALEEINEAGYLGEGVTLAVQYEDAVSADDAINAMTRLVEEAGVPAVLGPTLSTHAFAADPIAQENSVPVMGVSNTASGITEMGDYVFRNSLPESSVIPGTIAQSSEILGYEAVGVLYGDDDDFTLSGYEVFIEALDELGIEILGEETFARGDVDFNAQLSNLLAANPEALIVSALAAEGVQIIVQARDLGYEGPIIGGNGLNSPAIIENSGEAAEGVIVGAAWNSVSDNPLSQAFVTNFQDAYDGNPDQFAAQAYSGAWLMAQAIRCADSVEPDAIRDALATITDFETPLGTFSFSEDRNPIHDPVVQIVVDGAFGVLGAEMDDMGEMEMDESEEESDE